VREKYGKLIFVMLETHGRVRRVNCGIKTHLLAVCASRLIIPLLCTQSPLREE
jgi:hypothetical protein